MTSRLRVRKVMRMAPTVAVPDMLDTSPKIQPA
jgi:hypothetical protein